MRGRGPHARRSFGLYPRVGVVRVLRRAVGIFTTAIFFCAFTILVLEQIGLNFFELYYILHGFLTLSLASRSPPPTDAPLSSCGRGRLLLLRALEGLDSQPVQDLEHGVSASSFLVQNILIL